MVNQYDERKGADSDLCPRCKEYPKATYLKGIRESDKKPRADFCLTCDRDSKDISDSWFAL